MTLTTHAEIAAARAPQRGLRLQALVWFLARQMQGERERWLLWLPVFFGAGIAGYFALQVEPVWWSGPLLLGAAIGWSILGRNRALLLMPGLALAVGAAGFCVMQWRSHSVAAPVLLRNLGPIIVTGRVLMAESQPHGYRLTLRPGGGLGRERVQLQRVRVTVRGQARPQAGSLVRLRAVLMPPSAPLMPGAFDFARLAWFQQLGAVGYAVGPVTVLDSAEARPLADGIERLRQQISDRIRQALPGAAGAVAAALLTGDRGAIEEPILRDMRDSGLAHLLAISGLHVGLVAGSLFALVRLLLAGIGTLALSWPTKKVAAVVSLIGAFAYLLLTGMTVPTQRAFIMVGFAVFAVLLDRTAISMRVLAWAAMIVLVLAPESLLSASFQMSFAAVLGLIAVYEAASPRLAEWRRGGGAGRRLLMYLLAVALTTLVAGLATAPFAAFHFHRLASFGLAANLLAVPLMALAIMPLGMLALLLMPLGLESLALAPMGWAVDATLSLTQTVAGWPGATHMVPSFSAASLGALSLCGLWCCLWRGRWRWLGVVVAVALVTGTALSRQGDATEILVNGEGTRFAIRDPTGAVVLVPDRRRDRTGDVWLSSWGLDREEPLAPLPVPLRCDGYGCVYAGGERSTVTFASHLGALIDDCMRADIVIATVPTRWLCRQPSLVIDRFALFREGAHLLRLSGDAVSVRTVAQQQGARPWSRAWQRQHYRRQYFSTFGTERSAGPES